LAAWLVGQLQRGVDDSVSFERFVPQRNAHSASDLVESIGEPMTNRSQRPQRM
jgi:hypothetical protein